jgi:hypothetical protein
MTSRALLRYYYDNVFPNIVFSLVRMVTNNFKYDMSRVEFVPRWEIDGSGTVMNRDIVFRTPQDLITYCQTKLPHSLQVGGVMPGRRPFEGATDSESRQRDRLDIKRGLAVAFGPLVIDIDMDDYDREGVCACGKDKTMCEVCYATYIYVARQVIVEYWLERVFGFTKIVQVYSGKKGIHIWVCCERAFNMSDTQRRSLLERIARPMRSDGHVDEIYKLYLRPMFLATPTLVEKDKTCSLEKVFFYLYPRIDMNVGASAAHLKKLPLLPHQETGRLSIPLTGLEHNVPLKQVQISAGGIGPEELDMYMSCINYALNN